MDICWSRFKQYFCSLLSAPMRFPYYLSLLFISILASGQCLTDLRKVLPDRNSREQGYQVALGGDYMVVANNSDDSLGYVSGGAAYLYQKSPAGWNFIALLKPSNPTSYLQFGNMVKIDSLGETIAISSYGYNNGTIALARSDVYVFQKPASGWTTMTETERIKIPDSLFSITSISLDVKGNRLAVGKYFTDYTSQTGKVYVYSRSNSTQSFASGTAKTLISPSNCYSFGSSVALDHGYLAVNSDWFNNFYGVVFVYKILPDTLKEIAQLTTKDNISTSTWNQISFKDGVLAKQGYYGQTSVFIYAKPKNSDWQDAVESSSILLVDSPRFNLNIAVQVLDSLNIGVTSSFTNSGWPTEGMSSTGYFELISRAASQPWNNAIRNFIYQEILPVNSYNKPYATSAAWNGSQFVFTPSLDSPTSNFTNSVTSMTRSNNQWGSLLKVKLPRLNSAAHYFGQSIATGNGLFAIGDPHDSEFGPQAGAVYLYGKKGPGQLVRKKKIPPPWESVTDTFFGSSISMTDSLIAIGAVDYAHNGAVYLYQVLDTALNLTLQQKILPPADGLYQFGDQVAISAKVLAVTTFNSKGVNGTNNTFAVYEKNGSAWTLSQVIDVHNAWLHYQTMRLEIRSDSIFVYTGVGGYAGEGTGLYIYTKDNTGKWNWTTTFAVPAGISSSDVSFKVTENHVFMGMPGTSVAGKTNVGAVLVYYKNPGESWPAGSINPVTIIHPSDTIANGYFGYSVNSIENTLIVGAPGTYNYFDSNNNFVLRNQAGATYVFTAEDYYWKTALQLLKLQGTEYSQPLSDLMGSSVAVDHDSYYSAAKYENNDHGAQAGTVYTIATPPLVKLIAPVCSENPPFKLFGYPFGGTWSGPGLTGASNDSFSAALVGVGKFLLTYKTPNCTYEGKLLIEVRPSPKAVLSTASSITICPQNPQTISIATVDSATYQWYYRPLNGGSAVIIAGQKSPQLAVGLNGYYYCSVTKGGCSVQSPAVTVNYETPDASIGPQDIVCDNSKTLPLRAAPAGGIWGGTGVSSAGVFNPSALTNGKYPVTYSFKSAKGCNYSLRDTVLIETIPKTKIVKVPGDYCITGLVKLSVDPITASLKYLWKYRNDSLAAWEFVDTLNLSNRTFVSEGLYESVVSNENCQIITSPIEVGGLNDLKLTLLPKDSVIAVCHDVEVKLSVTSLREGVNFEWLRSDTTDINFQTVENGQDLVVSQSGLYKAIGTLGFCNTELRPTLVIFFPKDTLLVPNVFTPNGDDTNPTFKILTSVKGYSLEIVNRWGDSVYTGTKESKPWDGSNNPSGVYFWNLDFRDCSNERKSARGWVQIVK